MHDFLFDHVHLEPEGQDATDRALWAADNVALTTVGIDVGSTTAHLSFARVHLRRAARGHASRYETLKHEVLWQSPILLTPYRRDGMIDVELLGQFVRGCYDEMGVDPDMIDSGAVILTGAALARPNAAAITDLFAAVVGRFVCATAGHDLEARLAAHGAQTAALSRRRGETVLNVDIGGGTTKFALVRDGVVVATAAAGIGARLVVEREGGAIVRHEPAADAIAADLGFTLGAAWADDQRRRFVRRMAAVVVGLMRGDPPDALTRALMLAGPLPDWRADPALAPAAIAFSGGVAEYLFEREHRRFDDLGPSLAHVLQHALADRTVGLPVWDTGHGIRATVTGAAHFTVQLSGATSWIGGGARLPVRNLPVAAVPLAPDDRVDADAVAQAVRAAVARAGVDDGPCALAFAWSGDPSHARLYAVAQGICAAAPGPLTLLIDGDVALTLGRLIATEVDPGRDVIALDGLALAPFDYVDIGAVMASAGTVPVVVKSLVF